MNTEIKINIALDPNKVPEKIEWNAPDGGMENQETHALFLAVWDQINKEALRIDLWTKEMTVEDMKRFYHQLFLSLAQTYQRATNEEDVTQFIGDFAEDFAKKAGIKM